MGAEAARRARTLDPSASISLVLATGYEYDLPDLSALAQIQRPLLLDNRTLNYAAFDPASGFTRLHSTAGEMPFGFVGFMPLKIPMGTFFYQAKLFLESVLGVPGTPR